MADTCVVYWLFDDKCVCPWRHGYVGVTTCWRKRIERHRRVFGQVFSTQILYRGTKSECLKVEWQFRPHSRIGWNAYPGGAKTRAGAIIGAIGRRRMSEAAKKRPPRSPETLEKLRVRKIGTTNKGRIGQRKTEDEKKKIAESNRGKTLGEDTRRRISLSLRGKTNHLGYRHTDKTKQTIRMKKLGVAVHSEEHKKTLAERMRGNAFTKNKPWSAARRLAWLQRVARRDDAPAPTMEM